MPNLSKSVVKMNRRIEMNLQLNPEISEIINESYRKFESDIKSLVRIRSSCRCRDYVVKAKRTNEEIRAELCEMIDEIIKK